MRFTVHTGKGKTPFELHHGRKPRTKLVNLANKQISLLSKWKTLCNLENPERLSCLNNTGIAEETARTIWSWPRRRAQQ